MLGVQKAEETEKVAENIFEDIKAENFHNLGKEIDLQVQEVQRVLNKIKQRGPNQDIL